MGNGAERSGSVHTGVRSPYPSLPGRPAQSMLFVGPRSPRRSAAWTLDEQGARHRLRLIVGAFTALVWIDNVTEHYRGDFRRRLMWVPVIANPLVTVVAIASAWSPRGLWRRLFLVASTVQVVVAVVGFVEHHRGIMRRPGSGIRSYIYNSWYGPPLFAPLQYLGFGVLGLIATLPYKAVAPLLRHLSLRRVLRIFTAMNVPPLWAEITYFHARGTYQDSFQWLPVVALPAAGAASAVAGARDTAATSRAHQTASRSLIGLGAVGTAFHIIGLARRYHGLDRRSRLFNWLSGPPVPAPLQLIGLGLAALAAEKRRDRS